MIQTLKSLDGCLDFIHSFDRDPDYSAPQLFASAEEKLQRSIDRPEHHLLLGVFDAGKLTGIFSFLKTEDEQYLELLAGLSRSAAAYEEMLEKLRADYPGWQADFVFNPRNELLKTLLRQRQAEFDSVQRRMDLIEPTPAGDTSGIEPLSERYLSQYLAIHTTDRYWTGEKVAEATERFRVLLAVDQGSVVGYVDMTNDLNGDNEPYDLFVKPADRRRGWGRKLMTKAIELNRPNGMWLLVDEDNEPAIRLYTSLGFRVEPQRDNQTATWHIPV